MSLDNKAKRVNQIGNPAADLPPKLISNDKFGTKRQQQHTLHSWKTNSDEISNDKFSTKRQQQHILHSWKTNKNRRNRINKKQQGNEAKIVSNELTFDQYGVTHCHRMNYTQFSQLRWSYSDYLINGCITRWSRSTETTIWNQISNTQWKSK